MANKVYFRDDGTLRFADASGTVVAKANDQEHARRLMACWSAFLQPETTDIERIAGRRIRRSYWKFASAVRGVGTGSARGICRGAPLGPFRRRTKR